MNTNNDTVSKLSKALNELIVAYEKLQSDNKVLKAKNVELSEEIDTIKKDKVNIESTYKELSSTKEKQETNLNSMLGKIDSLLGSNISGKNELKEIILEEKVKEETVVVEKEEPIADETKMIEENIFDLKIEEKPEKKPSLDDINIKKENRIDFDRMESLLNGN